MGKYDLMTTLEIDKIVRAHLGNEYGRKLTYNEIRQLALILEGMGNETQRELRQCLIYMYKVNNKQNTMSLSDSERKKRNADIIRDYMSGMHYIDIAEKYKIAPNYVHAIVRENTFKKRY